MGEWPWAVPPHGAAASTSASERLALDNAATAAWLLALPCAGLVAALVLVLGKPLGQLVYPPLKPSELWPWEHSYLLPEPQEEGGYLLALVLPCLLPLAALRTAHHISGMPGRAVSAIVSLARASTLALITACFIGQGSARYLSIGAGTVQERYFTPATLIVGASIAFVLPIGLRHATIRRRVVAALRDSGGRHIAAVTVAGVATTAWVLHAVNSDASIGWTDSAVSYNIPFTADDPFAVVNGLTPFVDMAPLYSSLWPLLIAPALLTFGKTLLVLTVTMCSLSIAALVAVYGALRRVTRSPLGALLLYLPLLATSLFTVEGTQEYGYTIATYFSVFPLRYAGPLLLAWLTSRHLDRPATRAAWPLFAVAGLVVLNNLSFGLPAFAATLIALEIGNGKAFRPRLARDVFAGVLLASLGLCALTLTRAGAWPDFGQMFLSSRYFVSGLASTPIPGVLGLPLLVFATYVAAIAVAVVRKRNGEVGSLTGMLAWSGIFGLGALAYFIAESDPQWLKANFCAWALALAFLAVVVVRRLAQTHARLPELPDLAVLFGIGMMVCSLAQLASPWSQIARLTANHHGDPPGGLTADSYLPDPAARSFIASLAEGRGFYIERGTPVALLTINGHRIADAYGIVNVSPYANIMSMLAPSFLRIVVADLRRAGGNTVIIPGDEPATPDVYAALFRLGFGVVTSDGVARANSPGVRARIESMRGEPIMKFVDLRTPHPRALRRGRPILVEEMRRSPW